MRRLSTAVLALSGLLLVVSVLSAAGCGRYGKPVRSAPAPEQSEHAQDAEKR